MAKSPTVHKDKLGRELAVSDPVCYPSSNTLCIGTITKLNNIMVKVQEINTKSYRAANYLKYPHDVIKLDGPEVTFYVLKHTKS